jgi:hypothetical protein
MTTPNQSEPDTIQAALGQGAYTVAGGGSSNWGQDTSKEGVIALITGTPAGIGTGLTGLPSVVTNLTNYVKNMPLDTLQVVQPFIPGSDPADFTNVDDATTAIIDSLGLSWILGANGLVTYLLILLDVFHLTYNAGSVSDPPGTLGVGGVGAGKPTWYSAWNGLLALCGVATGTTPTDAAPTIGGAITGTQTSINTHTDWFGRFITDLTVLLDFFHLTYELGSPADSITHTGTNGKLTWYAAWNNLMDLFGVVQSTTALTDPTPTIGTVAATNQNTVIDLSSAVQELQTNAGAIDQSNAGFAINFNNYANGSWPTTDWPVTYTGSGTSVLAISGGNAVMQAGTGGDITALVNYVTPTNSDYQVFQATIAGLPQGAAKTLAAVRMNAAKTSYVYAGISLSGFSLNWELGCYVSGTKTVFATGTGAPLNFTFKLLAGVGGNPYRFVGLSGGTTVFDYTDGSHVSQVGASYRYFGFKSTTDNSGQYVPAPGSFVGCYDDSPGAVAGSGIEQYSTAGSTSLAGFSIGTPYKFPSNFFDTTARCSSDLSYSGNAVTIGKSGWYTATIRSTIAVVISSGNFYTSPVVFKNTGAYRAGAPAISGNFVGAHVETGAIGGSVEFYASSGDVIEPGFLVESYVGGIVSSANATGDAGGIRTYWTVALSNRSLN